MSANLSSVLIRNKPEPQISAANLSSVLARHNMSAATPAIDTDYNKGGVLSGTAYVGGKIGTGALGILEGA